MKKSRIKNTALNSIIGIINYLLIIIASFVVRKIFAEKLGAEFLGLSSLFTSVITFLSLTELGIGTAMVFFLYKPINEQDHATIRKYMSFYKKAYILISCIILILGIAIAFVIPLFAETSIEQQKVVVYFLLYVVNSSISYLFAYKKSILYADQNSKVVVMIHGSTKLLSNIIQVILLIFTGSFLLYIISMIVFTALDNIVCSMYVNRHYAFIKDKIIAKLSPSEKKLFFAKVFPVFLQNLCSTIVVSSDSIIASAFLGVTLVGLYSNYTLITQTLKTLYSQVFSAFTNSFGNLAVQEDKAKCLSVYERTMFVAFIITCFCCSCFIGLIQPFITIVFGESFVLPIEIGIAICCNYYFISMNVPAVSVQNAIGLHKKDTWVMIVQALFNIVLSIVLGKYIGLIGIILATVMSTVLCPFISKEYVIYKHFFHAPVYKQFLRQLGYFLFTVAICGLSYLIFNIIISKIAIWVFILQLLGVVVLSLGILIITFWKTKHFKYFIGMLKQILSRKKNVNKEDF